MKAQEDFAGKKAKCGKCGHKFTIIFDDAADAEFIPLESPSPVQKVPGTTPATGREKVR